MEADPVEIWLSKMEKRHSRNQNTTRLYQATLEKFCSFVNMTPDQIVEEWKKAKYDLKTREQYIDEMLEKIEFYENYLGKQDLCKNSISTYLAGIASFFKYMRIPAKIELFRAHPKYHNRDITKEEFKRILNNVNPRDRAFFLMMAQSGLRPVTLMQLTFEQIREDFEADKIPCCIKVSRIKTKGEYVDHFTFIGEDAVEALKAYFAERGVPKDNERIFKGVKTPNAFSMRFGYAVRSLELIRPENMRQEGKPQPLRLYCLRKYFRKFAGSAGQDYVNFWMGHTLGVDDHYFSRDVEHHRKIYGEKAMPNLRIFEPSALETEQTIRRLEKKVDELRQENLELRQRLNAHTLSSDQVQELLRRIEKLEKQVKS